MEKPGWQTSEFWVTIGTGLAAVAVAVLVAFGYATQESAETIGVAITQGAIAVGMIVGAVFTVVEYIKSRTEIKKQKK